MLKYYMQNLEHPYDITYFQEDKPLGTIGSVSLLKNKIRTPFLFPIVILSLTKIIVRCMITIWKIKTTLLS